MSAWAGTEKFQCVCGRECSVMRDSDGEMVWFCFAHTRQSGLFCPVPPKPDDWTDPPTRAQVLALYNQMAEAARSEVSRG